MVAVGRALVAQPELLIVDELSLGLAPIVLQEIQGMIATLAPMRERAAALRRDPAGVNARLREGARRARARAQQTMVEVRDKMGLLHE